MIASLSGLIEEKSGDQVVVDVSGVGYRVTVSLRTQARLPPEGERVKLRIQTVVREDAFDLYGFASLAEEQLFLMLTSVATVGPRSAMNVLGGLDPGELAHAIASADLARLTKIHGVGKRTAERLIVELKEKVQPLLATAPSAPAGTAAPAAPGQRGDLTAALINLGYKPAQAEKAAEQAEQRAGAEAPLETLIREALRAARG